MSILDKQIRVARIRLMLNEVMRHVAVGMLIAAALWLLAVLIERLFVIGVPLGPAAAVAGFAGLIVVFVGAYRARIDALAAAVVLDGAAGLKERVSTALTCRTDDDPFARATLHDAEKTAGAIHVPSHVKYQAPGLWPWSIASVVIAMIFFYFMPAVNLLAEDGGSIEGEDLANAAQAERQEVEAALRAQMRKVQKRLDDKPALADIRDEIDHLEFPDKPTQTPEDVRREAVKKIERVADKWKERLEADDMKSLEQLKRELEKLETPKGDDHASKLTQAMASGDMAAAKKALSDLKKDLEEAAQHGDPAAKKKLADMQKKLDDLAEQLAKLADQQKMQKDLENKAGLSEEEAKRLLERMKGKSPEEIAEELKKQLAESGLTEKQLKQMAKKIAQNQQAMKQLQNLAQSMAQAAKACKDCQKGQKGDGGKAAQGALDAAMGQMSELEMAEQMMNELEAQIAELEDLKQGVNEGQGGGGDPADPNQIGSQGPQAGYGYGSRIGKERAAHSYKAKKAGARTSGGKIIGQMLIDGPQVRGDASAEAAETVNSAVRTAEDAVEREEVPRQYQRVVQKYFEQLAGLLNERQPAKESGDQDNPEDQTEKPESQEESQDDESNP